MIQGVTSVWKLKSAQQLATAFTLVDNQEMMQQFLRDVMTEKEIIEMSARLQAARMLRDGAKYADIIEQTKLSSRTVARISDWLQEGCGGYQAALDLLDAHAAHIAPARAE